MVFIGNLVNVSAIKKLPELIFNPKLIKPKEEYNNVSEIPFDSLKRQGFRGLIFDKDNTLTLPYHYPLTNTSVKGLIKALHAFPKSNIALFSNTIGYSKYQSKLDKLEIRYNQYYFIPNEWKDILKEEKLKLIGDKITLRRNITIPNLLKPKFFQIPTIHHLKPVRNCSNFSYSTTFPPLSIQ
jgi:hypothetical protein